MNKIDLIAKTRHDARKVVEINSNCFIIFQDNGGGSGDDEKIGGVVLDGGRLGFLGAAILKPWPPGVIILA